MYGEVYLKNIKQNMTDLNNDTLKFTVYVLWEDDEVVYVGQSTSIHTRIETHKKSGKKFNRYSYFNVKDKHEMDSVESFLIQALKPKYNKTVEPSYIALKDVRKRAIETNSKLKWVEEIYTTRLSSTLESRGYPIVYKGRKAYIPILWLSKAVAEVIDIGEGCLKLE